MKKWALCLLLMLLAASVLLTSAMADGGTTITVEPGCDRKTIQAALDEGLNATESNPLTVILPAGTYLLDDHQLRIYSNTTLKLESGAVVRRTNYSQRMLGSGYTDSTVGGYGQLKNVTITGGTWDGASDASSTGNLMTLWHGSNITISNTTMKGVCGGHFIELSGIDGATITGCTFTDALRSPRTNYDYSGDSDPEDSGGASIRSEAVQFGAAKESDSVSAKPYDGTVCKNITVSGCTFNNCISGVGNHHPGNTATGITIKNNTFKNMYAPCINMYSMTGTVTGNTATNARAFLRVTYGGNVTASGNTVTYGYTSVDAKLQQDTIFVDGSTLVFKNNKIYGTGRRALAGNSSTVTLTDNLFDMSSFSVKKQNTVQFIGSTVNVTGNTIKNAPSTGLSLYSVKAATGYKQIANNIVTDSGNQGIRLESTTGMTVKGNTVTNAVTNGIHLESSSKITIAGNTVGGKISMGIRVIGGSGNVVKDNTITAPGSHGVSMSSSTGSSSVTGNKVTQAGGQGIRLDSCKGVTVSGNTIATPASSGVYIDKGSNYTVSENEITSAKQNGVYLGDATGTNTVSGNTISKAGNNGVYISGSTGVKVTDNTITNGSKYGIVFTSQASGTVSGNTIKKSANNAIRVDGTDKQVTVSGNTVDTITGKSVNAVMISGSTKVTLTGNTVKGATNAGIRVMSKSNVTLENNKVSKSGSHGISAENSTVTLVGNTVSSSGGYGVFMSGATFVISANKISGSKNADIRLADSSSSKGSGTVVDNTGKISNKATGKVKDQLETPSGIKATAGKKGVAIEWQAVTGAVNYRVLYKADGKWQKLTDTTGTSYTWTDAPNGAYSISVRCLSASGKSYTSAYDTKGVSVTVGSGTLAAPVISKVSGTAGKVTIKWGKVKGAVNYRVYYKTTGSWKKLTDTTSTSYTWKKAKAGTTYSFTVRCMSADGKKATSSYDTTGTSYTVPLATPKVSKVSGSAAKGVTIKWGKVEGAVKYRVYYKTTGGWKKLTDTADTSYTWKKAKAGTTYAFTVRCLSADGKTFTSDYDTTGVSITVK